MCVCVCVCLCVWADRLTVHAESQRERVKQAASSCIGTSHWGQRFPASFPIPSPLSSPPEALCRQKRPPSTCPHTHTCKYPYPMREQYYAHQQATDGCASVRRHCKSEILKGKSSMVILSLGLFWLCVCVCVCVCVYAFWASSGQLD